MPAPRKRYDAVEMKPLSSSKGGDDDDDDDDSSPKKSKMDEWLTYILHKLHALLWLVVASALAMYVDLLDLLVLGHPPARPEAQMNRFFFYVGLAGFGGWLCSTRAKMRGARVCCGRPCVRRCLWVSAGGR